MAKGRIDLTNNFGETTENTINKQGGDEGPEFTFASGAGLYSGEGAPEIEATPGSLYLRTDGANNSQVMYVTFDGETWAPLVTA